MMPEDVRIGLGSAGQLPIFEQGLVAETLLKRFGQRGMVIASVTLDFHEHVAQQGHDGCPFLLVEHGDCSVAAPTVEEVCHGLDS